MDGFRREWTVFKSNYPLTSLSRQKIHIICRCIPCQAINCTWSGIRNFPQTRKTQPRTRTKLHFPSTSQQMDAPRQEARDVHVHSSWCRGPDTVKHPLEAPIFWFPSGYVYLRTGYATGLGFRTYIYVWKYERVKCFCCNVVFFKFIYCEGVSHGSMSTSGRDGPHRTLIGTHGWRCCTGSYNKHIQFRPMSVLNTLGGATSGIFYACTRMCVCEWVSEWVVCLRARTCVCVEYQKRFNDI